MSIIYCNKKVFRPTGLIGLVISLFFVSLTFGEMPEEPSPEELTKDATVVLAAEAVESVDIKPSVNINYRIIAFKVHKVYKGYIDASPGSGWFTKDKGWLSSDPLVIYVIILSSGTRTDYLVPSYKQGSKYVLFLEPVVRIECLYIRSELDIIWKETPWSKSLESKILKIIKEQTSLRILNPLGTDVKYSIPKEAVEKAASFSKYQRKHKDKYSKKLEYWLDGKIVGRRLWSSTGKLIYEVPIKHGKRHGISKVWYDNGKPLYESPYKNGKLHGVYKSWEEQNKMDVSYWIEGQNVTKEAYIQAAKINWSLSSQDFEDVNDYPENEVDIKTGLPYKEEFIDIVKTIIANDGDVDQGNERIGIAPLRLAAMLNYQEVVELLLDNGANPNFIGPDPSGSTPLHEAVSNSNLNICKLLIEGGADINAQEMRLGFTPLHFAVEAKESNNFDLIKLLVTKGADLNLKNKLNETPLDIAKENGWEKAAEFLQNMSKSVTDVNEISN